MTAAGPRDDPSWLVGGGEMGQLIREMDWSTTALGPLDGWPRTLRTMVSVCLASHFPMSIAWGPQLLQIYNDSYRPLCGAKHPRSMGQDFRACWAAAWPAVGEAFDRALAGEAQFIENQRIFLNRSGSSEERWFTFSFSPIPDEAGGIGGIFHPVTETTARMLSERRVRSLRDLAASAGGAQTLSSACARIIETLAGDAFDVPFVLLYLIDEEATRARLAGVVGLEPGAAASPLVVDLGGLGDSGWPLARALAQRRIELVDDLDHRFGALRCGPYPEPPQAAFVSVIHPPGLEDPVGLLVAGVSSRLDLDDAYRDYHAMLASAVTAAISGALAYQEERKRADVLAELLARGADRLRLAQEATGLGIWEMNPEMKNLCCNEECVALLGLPPGSSLDYDVFLQALHPDDRARVHEAVQRALDPAGDGAYAIEYRTVSRHGGVERCVAARGHVVDAGAGRPRRFLGTILDVTERAELMAREQRARAGAEEANRLKDEFLATVSHELRTPLNAILGWASMLSHTQPSPAKLARGLDVIRRNAEAQKAIIEDILDVSRIITGDLRIEQELVDFEAVVKDGLDVIMPSAAAKDIDVRYRRASEPCSLVGDPCRLRQIVWNLLSNAVKFTPAGGHVEVGLDRIGGAVRLRIEDTGEGIAPDLLPLVFDRFRQADSSTTRRHGGLGLGLSIVRHLVELHGGHARAESPGRGQGATFTIELPVRALALAPPEPTDRG